MFLCGLLALVGVLILGQFIGNSSLVAQSRSLHSGVTSRIKTAVYWTAPTISLKHVPELARHDMIIADLDNMFTSLASLRKLKELNPALKLLCYSNPMEVFELSLPMKDRPLQSAWTREIKDRYPGWLLNTAGGKKAIFYEGMRMLNMTTTCPRLDGKIYVEWMADYLIGKVLSVKASPDSALIWDGYFQDNSSPTISWISPRDQFDADGDRRPDEDHVLDRNWSEGNRLFLSKIRQAMGRKFIMIGNKGVTDWSDLLDGRMFEWWPNDYLGDKKDGGWWQSLVNSHQTGEYTILQVNEKDVELAVATALLSNRSPYISVGQNSLRYPEVLTTELGKGGEVLIRREFEGGYIEVNPAKRSARIVKQ